jgi:hypothetical protein
LAVKSRAQLPPGGRSGMKLTIFRVMGSMAAAAVVSVLGAAVVAVVAGGAVVAVVAGAAVVAVVAGAPVVVVSSPPQAKSAKDIVRITTRPRVNSASFFMREPPVLSSAWSLQQ